MKRRELILPTDYREWVVLGTRLGMTYGPAKREADGGLAAVAIVLQGV